jgi:hypothetical protein
MSTVVTTLFEAGPYEAGVAALLNSLVSAGFEGRVWCGVTGGAPAWLREHDGGGASGHGIDVRVESLTTDRYLSLYKADFLRTVAAAEPDASSFVYFDPDICVKCEWSFVERWAGRGIAVVTDMVGPSPASSPIRLDWLDLCDSLGVKVPHQDTTLDVRASAGFVGVSRDCMGVLDLWGELIDAALATATHQVPPLIRRPGGAGYDEDAFNVALMGWADRVSIAGPEAMDFTPAGSSVFSHAAGRPTKPWDKHYIRSALVGKPPSRTVREHLRHRAGPFDPKPRWWLRKELFRYRVARAIGAFVRRLDD